MKLDYSKLTTRKNSNLLAVHLHKVQPSMKPTARLGIAERTMPIICIILGVGVPYLLLKIALQATLLRSH